MINSVRFALAVSVLAASAFGTNAFAQNQEEAKTSQIVLAQLKRNPGLVADQLHVETVGRTVYLSGVVDSENERADAETIARSLPQVDEVVNLLVEFGAGA
jgi:osmotically-inducible protein OsmY